MLQGGKPTSSTTFCAHQKTAKRRRLKVSFFIFFSSFLWYLSKIVCANYSGMSQKCPTELTFTFKALVFSKLRHKRNWRNVRFWPHVFSTDTSFSIFAHFSERSFALILLYRRNISQTVVFSPTARLIPTWANFC